MPERRERQGRCEGCGRSLRHGKVCRRCQAEIARQLDLARRLAARKFAGIAFRGKVGQFRAQVLPEIRRAAMKGASLATADRRLQARLVTLMSRTEVAA